MTDFEVISEIYNSFDHVNPLQPDDQFYVDCQKVRGDSNIINEMGRGILLAEKAVCQLYSGHRGAGKSTELLRLTKYLKEKGYRAVYFDAASGKDIDPNEARYTDVLLACTQRLLKEFENECDEHAIIKWLKDRGESLKALATMGIVVGDSAVGFFTQIVANLRPSPEMREKIRKKIDPHTPSLIEALNEFIQKADKKQQGSKLVLIVDGLDRIVPTRIKEDRTNHDEIFIERSGQLSALKCHVIYTVPISMVYSGNANDLLANYGAVKTLPMVVVRNKGRDREIYAEGIVKLKELVMSRVRKTLPNVQIKDVFAEEQTLTDLCVMSGGILRELVRFMKEVMRKTEKLPISANVVKRTISEMRDSYRGMILESQWELLARVYLTQDIVNNADYRKLLLNRFVLEYKQIHDDGVVTWYDVHPLLEEIDRFKDAVEKVKQNNG